MQTDPTPQPGCVHAAEARAGLILFQAGLPLQGCFWDCRDVSHREGEKQRALKGSGVGGLAECQPAGLGLVSGRIRAVTGPPHLALIQSQQGWGEGARTLTWKPLGVGLPKLGPCSHLWLPLGPPAGRGTFENYVLVSEMRHLDCSLALALSPQVSNLDIPKMAATSVKQ